jgi:hypothetical protein
MEERLDAEHARMLEQKKAFCEEQQQLLEKERQHFELQRQRFEQEFEETKKRSANMLEQIGAMFAVGNAAVAAAYENVERARSAAEILTRQPPPKSTSGENATEFGKHLVTVIGDLAGRVLDRDPEAQQKLKEMTHQVLGIAPAPGGQESAEAASSPGAAPAAPSDRASQEPAPKPRKESPAAPELTVANLLAIVKLVPEDKVHEVAAKLGVAPENVPLHALLPLAEEAARTQQQSQPASEA